MTVIAFVQLGAAMLSQARATDHGNTRIAFMGEIPIFFFSRHTIRVDAQRHRAEITGGYQVGLAATSPGFFAASRQIRVVHIHQHWRRSAEGEQLYKVIQEKKAGGGAGGGSKGESLHPRTTFVAMKAVGHAPWLSRRRGRARAVAQSLLGFNSGSFCRRRLQGLAGIGGTKTDIYGGRI